MKESVKTIIGKRIKGIVTKERPDSPRHQLFLIFSDDTYFEFISTNGDISCAGGVDKGGIDAVRNYCGRNFITLESCDESIVDRPMETGNEQKEDGKKSQPSFSSLSTPTRKPQLPMSAEDELKGMGPQGISDLLDEVFGPEPTSPLPTHPTGTTYESNLPKLDNSPVSESTPVIPMTSQELVLFLEGKAKIFLKEGYLSPHDLMEMVDEQAAMYLPKNPNPMQLIDSMMEASELTLLGPTALHEWIEGMSKEQRDDLTLEAIAEVMNRYSSLE